MAKTEIYYFTGTGNSLSVARMLATQLDGALIPIAASDDQDEIVSEADVIGITFPTYYADVPAIVRRFARKLVARPSAYIFGVITYGGAFGTALSYLDRLLQSQGHGLDAGFGVHMPQNAFHKFWENRPRAFRRSAQRARAIATAVERRQTGMDYTNRLLQAAISPFAKSFERSSIRFLEQAAGTASPSGLTLEALIPLIDQTYIASDACTGCGICAQVCPVGNISMENGRPVWHQHCENCLACFNWCPVDALRGSVSKNEYHYKHPEVTLQDMIQQRSLRSGD